MIQTALNGMMAILLAKFLINDLPHASGLFENPGSKEGGLAARLAEMKKSIRPTGPRPTGAEFERRSVRDVLEAPRRDEYYVLVSRYYPREFRRRALKLKETPIDVWDRSLAPSPELLKWWLGGPVIPERWKEYTRRFLGEIPPALTRGKAESYRLKALGKKVVFVCMEEDREYPYCHTWILLDVLEGRQ